MPTQDTRLKTIYEYFGKAPANDFRSAGTLTTFRAEWAKLTDEDKNQLEKGIKDGTFTY